MTVKRARLSHLTFALFLEELMAGPCTTTSLVETTGLKRQTVNVILSTMHKRKVVHISGWENNAAGRSSVRVFALGQGRDAPRKPKSRLEINRAFRARQAISSLAAAVGGRVRPAANDDQRSAA